MATIFDDDENEAGGLIAYTVEIVTAHVAHNSVAMADVPGFIQNVHGALAGLTGPAEPEATDAKPIMDPRKAVKQDSITCLVCGRKGKLLTAHLRAQHGLSPDEYREKFGLPKTYPVASKRYIDNARDRALSLGLGAKMQKAKKAKAAGTRPALKAVGKA